MTIRIESKSDHRAIWKINKEAFGQEEEANLVDALRNDPAFIPELSLVAEIDGKVVGHILFSRISIVDGKTEHPSLALAPMSVLPDFQKQGIGSALIRTGLDTSRQMGFSSVVVLGHKDYYPRFGFEPASRWGIRAPFDVPGDVFMAIELSENSLNGVSGTVQYAAPFMEL